MKKCTLLVLVLLLQISLGASVCASASPVRFGVYENYPLVFTDEDGRVSGIFIDVLEYIADQEGWTIEYVHGDWPDLLDQLERGEIDLLGAIAYTEARSVLFDFSTESVITNWGQIYTRPGAKIESILDLDGKTIAVLEGDIHAQAFKDLLESFGVAAGLIEVKDYQSVFAALQRGEADAGVANRLVALQNAGAYDIRETNIIFNPIENRFAVTKDVHQDLLAMLDAHLRTLKADDDSIYYQSLDRWFGGASRWRMPTWMPWVGLIFGGLLLTFAIATPVLRVQVRARTRELQAEVTERKQAEEALRQQEHFISTVVNTSPAIIYVYDLETQSNVFINTGIERLLNYSPQELQAMGAELFPRLIHPDDLPAVIESQEQIAAARDEEVLEIEYRMRHKDGSWRTLHSYERPFLRNADGSLKQKVGVALDVTERKQAEEAIQQRSKDLAALLEVSQALATTLDLETVLQTIIEGATHLVELDSGAIYLLQGEGLYLGATTPPLPPQFPEMFRRASLRDHPHIRQSLSTGLPVILPDTATAELTPAERAISEARGLRSILYLPLLIEKRAVGTLILGTVGETRSFSEAEIDLYRTLCSQAALAVENARLYKQVQHNARELELRVALRTDELAEVNRSLESFVYSVSHDLRAPLRAITGFAEIIARRHRDSLNEEARHYFDNILDAARNMEELIADLLAYSRLGKKTPALTTVSLNETMGDVLSELASGGASEGAEISVDPDLPRVKAAPTLLRQALLNLLENALKYRRLETGHRVEVRGRRKGKQVVIEVADNGIGIDPQYHEKIFDIFQRLHGQDAYPGTGIGLAIVKRAVTLMGGTVEVESTPGQGSLFRLTLAAAEMTA